MSVLAANAYATVACPPTSLGTIVSPSRSHVFYHKDGPTMPFHLARAYCNAQGMKLASLFLEEDKNDIMDNGILGSETRITALSFGCCSMKILSRHTFLD